jgi:hypothetical protein
MKMEERAGERRRWGSKGCEKLAYFGVRVKTGDGSEEVRIKYACPIRDHLNPTDEICLEITSRGAEKKRPETLEPQCPATSPVYNSRNCFLDF